MISNPLQPDDRHGSQTAPPQRLAAAPCVLAFAFALAMVVLFLGGDSVRASLRYERNAVLGGELWRLVSCHFVHANGWHLGLNLAGVGLIALLFPAHMRTREWLCVALFAMLAIGAGLVAFEPGVAWYVGASGMLHGLLAAGAVAWWRRERGPLAAVLTLVLVAKLAFESLEGSLPLAHGINVITAAHLYGAIGGTFAALLLMLRERHRGPTRVAERNGTI
jgi:rhomboid family GlyGly-CTERM serine protease